MTDFLHVMGVSEAPHQHHKILSLGLWTGQISFGFLILILMGRFSLVDIYPHINVIHLGLADTRSDMTPWITTIADIGRLLEL